MKKEKQSLQYILGVDGGNSKTYAVMVDSKGNRLGHGLSGNGNHQVIGLQAFKTNIEIAIKLALDEAGLEPNNIDFAQFGLAGADRETDFEKIHSVLEVLPFSQWGVVGDTLEGLRAGSSTNTGVALVCGAGTNAVGRNEKGETLQTGGFGYRFGDAAGGGYIAKEAFRTAVRAWECRGDSTCLTEWLPTGAGFKTIEDLYHYFLDHPKEPFPLSFTLTVHRAAEEGDGPAIHILEQVGYELGLAANSVITRLGGFNTYPIPIVLIGSVLQKGKSPHLLKALERTLEGKKLSYELLNLEMEPVYGSIMLGMDHLQIDVTHDILQSFSSLGSYDDNIE